MYFVPLNCALRNNKFYVYSTTIKKIKFTSFSFFVRATRKIELIHMAHILLDYKLM